LRGTTTIVSQRRRQWGGEDDEALLVLVADSFLEAASWPDHRYTAFYAIVPETCAIRHLVTVAAKSKSKTEQALAQCTTHRDLA
jgi:hypothetical protein